MTYQIRKVAVLGAGVMGAGIAAHQANIGIPSLLLDVVPAGEVKDRNIVARTGLDKTLKEGAKKWHPVCLPCFVIRMANSMGIACNGIGPDQAHHDFSLVQIRVGNNPQHACG